MPLTMHQLVDLRRHLIQQGTHMDRREPRLSRRIESESHIGEGATLGARSILVYVERGMGADAEALEPIFRSIFSIHSKSGHRHWLGCCLFGGSEEALTPVSVGESDNLTADSFVRIICDSARAVTGTTAAVVPSLSSPPSSHACAHQVVEDDLLVFICKDNPATFANGALAEYRGSLIRTGIWVFTHAECLRLTLGQLLCSSDATASNMDRGDARCPAAE